MASDYGLNFGFRRSDESVRVSEGRIKTPATGPALLIGTFVTIDAAAPGYLKVAPANAHIVPGVTGLLIQEEVWDRSIYERDRVDSFVLGLCKPNRLSVISTGAGTKFWLKNTGSQTRADGRVISAVQMFLPTGIAVGDGLAWDGTHYVHVAAGDATQVATVTFYDSTKGLLEAVLTA
jgi:hypothetical protein